MKTLEEKRKAKSLVYYERKKKLLVSGVEMGRWRVGEMESREMRSGGRWGDGE